MDRSHQPPPELESRGGTQGDRLERRCRLGIAHWLGLRRGRSLDGAPVLPDYDGGSILNLAASIRDACHDEPAATAAPLRMVATDRLRAATKIVLLVVDGCGAQFLDSHGRGSVMDHFRIGNITSVFPSTTASAITTFLTGLAPAAHALTGWHIYFDELDECLACLPLTTRAPREASWVADELPPRLFGHAGIFRGMNRRSIVISPHAIINSAFNRYHTESADLIGFGSMSEMFMHIAASLDDTAGPSFTYAYYATFDALAHRYGVESEAVERCFDQLDIGLARLIERRGKSGAILVVTADHGFIDSSVDRVVDLDDHPALGSMLARPLCGERRVAYCYVKHGMEMAFEDYVSARLQPAADLVPASRLIAEGWFGPGRPDARLCRRIGNYALVMKENWTVVDHVPGEQWHEMVGVHGGTSRAEMLVPLTVIDL